VLKLNNEHLENNGNIEAIEKLNCINAEIQKVDTLIDIIKSELSQKNAFLTNSDLLEIWKNKNIVAYRFNEGGIQEINIINNINN